MMYYPRGGGCVFGASWAKDFKSVRHVLVESEDELDSIMRSKYVQSYVSRTVYEGVRSALLDDKQVLFAGTACQVAGMKSYLGKLANASNFLAVDVICHGVPSPLLWEKWASWRENRAGTSLCDVNMRSKTTGWLSFSSEYKYTEEKDNASVVDRSVFMEDWYMKAFLKNASLRDSCFQCPSKRSCESDITLGDFWGIQHAHPEVEYDGGVSAVICNTVKGSAAVDAIKDKIEWGMSSLEKVLPGNPCLVCSATPYSKRDKFMSDLARGASIDELMAKYSFMPSFAQRVRGKLGRIKRKILNLFDRK